MNLKRWKLRNWTGECERKSVYVIAYGCASACDVRVCEYVKVYVRVFREQEREKGVERGGEKEGERERQNDSNLEAQQKWKYLSDFNGWIVRHKMTLPLKWTCVTTSEMSSYGQPRFNLSFNRYFSSETHNPKMSRNASNNVMCCRLGQVSQSLVSLRRERKYHRTTPKAG